MIINKSKGVPLKLKRYRAATSQYLKHQRFKENLKKSLYDRKKYPNEVKDIGSNG